MTHADKAAALIHFKLLCPCHMTNAFVPVDQGATVLFEHSQHHLTRMWSLLAQGIRLPSFSGMLGSNRACCQSLAIPPENGQCAIDLLRLSGSLQTATMSAGSGSSISTYVRLASCQEDIKACYHVMEQLRSKKMRWMADEDTFVRSVQHLQQQERYQLASLMLHDTGAVVAVAGYKVGQSLSNGKELYVHGKLPDATHPLAALHVSRVAVCSTIHYTLSARLASL
jgi:hypothetical protein